MAAHEAPLDDRVSRLRRAGTNRMAPPSRRGRTRRVAAVRRRTPRAVASLRGSSRQRSTREGDRRPRQQEAAVRDHPLKLVGRVVRGRKTADWGAVLVREPCARAHGLVHTRIDDVENCRGATLPRGPHLNGENSAKGGNERLRQRIQRHPIIVSSRLRSGRPDEEQHCIGGAACE